MIADLETPRFDNRFVRWISAEENGRVHVYGCQVRAVGPYMIEIHEMGYNLRVVICDRTAPVWFDMTGHAWCYPKRLGYSTVTACVWEWDFDPADPGATNPPGEWIKAIHTGCYREPGINQRGPDGVMVR